MKSKLIGWQKAAVLFLLVSSTFVGWFGHAQTIDLQLVDPKPQSGTFYSLQKVANGNNEPPLPWDPFPEFDVYSSTTFQPNFLVYFYNDLEWDYGSHRYSTELVDPPPDPGGGGEGEDPGLPSPPPEDPGTSIWLRIVRTNGGAFISASNVYCPNYYQLASRSNVNTGAWIPGQILQGVAGTNVIWFDFVKTDNPRMFFRVQPATNVNSLMPNMAVGIHDSELSRAHAAFPSNWNYFLLPMSVEEALRSDGTPFAVVKDDGLACNGLLLPNGLPKYPIVISLGSESVGDDEISQLTNYVAAGGFLFVGSSSFTRSTNGAFRSDFALANQMGIHCTPSSNNWVANSHFTKLVDHRILSHIPSGELTWRMPTSPGENSWGTCATHSSTKNNGGGYDGPHQIWNVTITNLDVEILATGDSSQPYIAIRPYGDGYFVYDAALQPLVGHGGFAPGMYAYVIFRKAIEWAFESAHRPVVRVSPWPFAYDAAFLVRHDLEDFANEISAVADSAYVESVNGAKGDYYFCTGRITNEAAYANILLGLKAAVSNYGATIGPHNGGLPNPSLSGDTNSGCHLTINDYEYWHWGPDEAVDVTNGVAYASNSLAISFNQIETWLAGYQPTNPRVWVAPYFNATREDCYKIQEQLNVKITGDQKLTPFPAFTLSTQTADKRYSILSEPTSDWFVAGVVAQSLDPWHWPGIHTSQTMHDGVDFYYANGFLINFYAHGLSTGFRSYPETAGDLIPDYIQYCRNSQLHPLLWPANARGLYEWWLKRANPQVTTSYITNGTHSIVLVGIAGATDPNTAIEVLAPGAGAVTISQVLTNGNAASTNDYRVNGERMKVRVGTNISNFQIEYVPTPLARNDYYYVEQGHSISNSPTTGVLSNDWAGFWSGLIATNVSGTYHGVLTLQTNGAFVYTPTNTFYGTECFSYLLKDALQSFGTGTVTIVVTKTNCLFSDDFRRCTGELAPWQVHLGDWAMSEGVMQGSSRVPAEYSFAYLTSAWENNSVSADIQFPAGSFGGGLGGRLGSGGGHYAAWVYPENSPGPVGDKILALVKFTDWRTFVVLDTLALSGVGTGWHTLNMSFITNRIDLSLNSTNVISFVDTNTPLTSGSVSLDMWTVASPYTMSISNLVVTPVP